MAEGGVSGIALGAAAVGGVFLYGGIRGKSPLAALQAIVQGQSPATVLQSQGISTTFGGATTTGAGASSTGSQSTVGGDYAPIDAAFKAWGFSKAGRAGALGNLEQESGFNPAGGMGDGGTSGGIAQWHLGRLTGLQNYAMAHGMDWRSLAAQLGWMKHELDGTYGDVYGYMRLASNPQDAAAYWGTRYEGFGDNSGPTRQANAQRIYGVLT